MLYRWHKKVDKNEYKSESLNTRKKLPIKHMKKIRKNKEKTDNENWEFKIVDYVFDTPDSCTCYNLSTNIKIKPRRRGL